MKNHTQKRQVHLASALNSTKHLKETYYQLLQTLVENQERTFFNSFYEIRIVARTKIDKDEFLNLQKNMS